MNFKDLTLATGSLLVLSASLASAQDLTISLWGGSYAEEFRRLIVEPFEKEYGVKVALDTGLSGERLAKLMATRGRHDRTREFFRRAEIALIESGVELPPELDAKIRLLENFSPATLNDDTKVRDWIEMFTMWPTKQTPGLRRQLECGPVGNRLPAYRAITHPALRHPMVLASMGQTLQSLTGERFQLGLGRSAMWRWRDYGVLAPTLQSLADLADRAAVARVIEEAARPYGEIDILVNAAGVNIRPPMAELTVADYDLTMAVNITAPYLLGQHFGPKMAERGWGRIINVASQQAISAFGDSGAYGVSKAAIAGLTRSQAEAWSRHGVMVNTIMPGFVVTPLTAPHLAVPGRVEAFAARTMIGRNGLPTDFAGAAVLLASDACLAMTGQMIFVDGGMSVH